MFIAFVRILSRMNCAVSKDCHVEENKIHIRVIQEAFLQRECTGVV
jgi:hypothetical protein